MDNNNNSKNINRNLLYSKFRFNVKILFYLFSLTGAGALGYKQYSLRNPAPSTTYSKIFYEKEFELCHDKITGPAKTVFLSSRNPRSHYRMITSKDYWDEVLRKSCNPVGPVTYENWMEQLYQSKYTSIVNTSSSEDFANKFLESCFTKDLINEYKSYKKSHQFIFDYKRGSTSEYKKCYNALKKTFYFSCYLHKMQEFYQNNKTLNIKNKQDKALIKAYVSKNSELIDANEETFNSLFETLRDLINPEQTVEDYLKEKDPLTYELVLINEIIYIKFYLINELYEEAVINYNEKLSTYKNSESLALYSFSAAIYCFFIFFLLSLIKEEN